MLNSILFLALAFHAAAVRFEDVPSKCQAALTEILGDDDRVVDWRPWRDHLRRLGYGADWVPTVMADPETWASKLRLRVRLDLDRPEWTWSDGLDAASSAVLTETPTSPLPFEYLAAIRGFDPGAAIDARLRRLEQTGEYLTETDGDLRWLARRASFWLSGPGTIDLAERILNRIDDPRDLVLTHRWLSPMIAADARERLRARFFDRLKAVTDDRPSLHRQEDHWRTLDHVSLDDLPEDDHRLVRRNWLRDRRYPARRDDSVRTVSFGVRDAFTCEDMAFRHLSSILPKNASAYLGRKAGPPPFVIRLNGYVIGLVKTVGDPSMLAIRNIVDGSGHRTLMMGGVYRIPHVVWDFPRRPVGPKGWRAIDLTGLRVRPLGPVLNHDAWCAQNIPLLLNFNPTPDADLPRWILGQVARHEDGMPLDRVRRRLHPVTWSNLLEYLDLLRRRLDAGPMNG